MKKLKLSEDLLLPIDIITQRVSILGRTGSGKSHTAGVLAEEAIKAKQQVIIADPKGDWWGLRSSANGKLAGLPITIMGGEHGDLPLDPMAGALVADIVINEGISVVLDFSLFESKAQEIRFMEAFCDRLYRKNKRPVLFIVDEADIFAPQKPEKNETVMLNRMETICRRGRSKGIGVVLISQRSASLHKGCLSQTELMIAHQTTAPQDKKALEYWVVAHGDDDLRDSFMTAIPKLKIGTAIVWSPSWLNIYSQINIRAKETYDSSETPRVGLRRRAPKVLASIDIERLKVHMAETIEKAKQEDPKLLREEIRQLKIQIASKPKIDPALLKREMDAMKKQPAVLGPITVTKTVSVKQPIVLTRDINRMAKAAEFIQKFHKKYEAATSMFGRAAADIEESIRVSKAMAKPLPAPIVHKIAKEELVIGRGTKLCNKCLQIEANCKCAKPNRHDGPKIPLRIIPRGPAPEPGLEKTVVDGERRILLALAAFHPTIVTLSHLAVLCGIKSTGSTMSTYISRLKRRGFICVEAGDSFSITSAGSQFIGPPKEPLTPAKVQAMWIGKFQKGPRTILEFLISCYPQKAPMETVSKHTGIKEDGSTFTTYISRLRAAGVIDITKEPEGKFVQASKSLFEVGA